jgi:hypothetical protein
LPVLGGDRRSAGDAQIMPDARVRHFWDERRVVGAWFARQTAYENNNGFVWDTYFLYGPEAA